MTIFIYIALIVIIQLIGLIFIYFTDKKLKIVLSIILVVTILTSIKLIVHIDSNYMLGDDAQLMFLRK